MFGEIENDDEKFNNLLEVYDARCLECEDGARARGKIIIAKPLLGHRGFDGGVDRRRW